MPTTREIQAAERSIRAGAGRRSMDLRRGRSEEGATLAEYGLLMVLIVVVCVAAVTLLGNTISIQFTNIAGGI